MPNAGLISTRDGKIIAETVKAVRSIPGLEGYIDRFKSASAQNASQNAVAILNNTSADLPAFSIVRIDKTVTTMTKGGTASTAINYRNLQTYVWTATVPDEGLTGQYGILQTQTPIGEIGEALLIGVSKVRLDDTDEGEYAEPQYDDMEKMKTSNAGRFPVLVVATSASDDTWGYVLLKKVEGIAHFHVQSIATSGVYLNCKRCDSAGSYPANDPTGANITTIKVYRANDFQPDQYDGLTLGTVTYTKVSAVQRTACIVCDTSDDETQYIKPDIITPSGSWLGSIIVADRIPALTIGADTFLWQEREGTRRWEMTCS